MIAALARSQRAPRRTSRVASIQITLPPAHARWRDTVTTVAHEAASIARDWLGAHPSGAITEITIDPPAWQGRGAMIVERQVAQR